VAKINPVKLKQDADKLEKAGKLDQAIGLYRQIIEDNPRDWNTINKVGDLYAKLNKTREATVEYAKVADFYAKDGFYVRAIAMWKKINKLDASALEPYTNLAELYAKQGLMTEAKSHFQMVVDEYVKRGKNREAGDVLKKLAEIDPADLKIRSKLADLYTREGNTPKAVAEALQVLEKGLKIDANSARLKAELGRVHLVQKNHDKAVQYLEEASRQSPRDAQILSRLGEAYLGAKRTKEAESTFKRALELDPQDQEAGAQMARVHLAQGHFDQAFEQLLPVVNRLVERREGDRGAALLQQIVQKNPAHVKTLVKLVEIYAQLGKESAAATASSHLTEAYINQGQFAEAAKVLEGLVAKDPQNQQHRSKLQMVRARLGGGQGPAPAPSALEGPAFEEEELDLSGSAEAPSFAPAPSSSPAPVASTRQIPAQRPAIEASGPLSEEDQEFVEEHLAEGKVFRKYGLLDKAADQFEAVIARFGDNVDARQELRDVYKEKEQPAKAAEQSLALAEIFRLKGDAAAAQVHEAEARKAAPEIVPAGPPAAPPPKKAAPPAAPPAPAPQPQPQPVLELEEEEVVIEEEADLTAEPVAEEAAAEEPPAEEAVEAEEELSSIELTEAVAEPEEEPAPLVEDETAPDVAAAEEIELSGADEEEPAVEPAAEAFPLETEELALAEPEPEPAPPPPPVPLKAAPVKPAAPPPPAARAKEPAPSAKAPAPPAAPALPADLQKVLDEVDSYVSLGFVEDAVEALQEIGARYAEHPALLAKIAELGLDRAALEKPAEAPAQEPAAPGALGDLELEGEIAPSFEEAQEAPAQAPAPEEDSFVAESVPAAEAPASPFDGGNLETELDELFGAQAAVEEPPAEAASTELGDAGLADIFKEFKKGVDKQLGKEDYDTRYNLGIAYKEMGLIDEAIAEFQLAAKDENRTLECSSMLGICFMEKGMPKLAVKWFEKGLKAEGRTDEEYQGLRYDLAMAHEAAGETDKALHLFTDLYGQNANFRDVAAKVRDLRAALR
jgi:pilus assembly protein FimV